MKNRIKIIISLLLITTFVFLSSCQGNEIEEYSGEEFHITSSNQDLDDALNELNHRLLRYDDYSIGEVSIPEGVSFNMGWQTQGLIWHNATAGALGSDKITPIYTGFLKERTQDDYGYIYDVSMFRQGLKSDNQAAFPMGWPFPLWYDAVDNSFEQYGMEEYAYFTTFEFNKKHDDTSRNWKAENGTFSTDNTGAASFSTDGGEGGNFMFYKDDIADILYFKQGINTICAPLIETDFDLKSSNLKDINFIWKTKKGGDTWFRASYKDYSTIAIESFDSFGARVYLPLYLNENWDNQIVTAIGIEFVPEDGTKLSIRDGKINYIRPGFDTRQTQFTLQWLNSFYYYVMYTRDLGVLKELMQKARRALLFFLHCLQAEDGLVNIGYLYGHNGIGCEFEDGKLVNNNVGNGIGNSYWDIFAESEVSIEANAWFYDCLCQMIQLEETCEKYDIETEKSYIKNRKIGGERVEYTYNSTSLKEIQKRFKEKFESPINPVLNEDGMWTNEGGFWVEEIGRFALGIREDNGKIIDYGFVYFNEEAICAGLGTREQQLSIMQWITGERIVKGDDSTGKDIYFYEFAPRFCTKDCSEQMNFCLASSLFQKESSPYVKYGSLFSRQVQDGGAILCWEYYDLVCITRVLGVDKAYERLKDITKWYNKVKKASTEYISYNFFEDYYVGLEKETNQGLYITQSSGKNGPGAVGLDSEFLENVMMVKAIPDSILQMRIDGFDSIVFTNDLPKGLNVCSCSNLKYGNCIYTMTSKSNSMEISNIRGAVNEKTTVTFKLKKPSGAYVVLANNKEVKDVVDEGDYISVTVPFDLVKVEIK